ncbi:MAG: prephenate dehydrogenase [Flexilinea sp.]
MAIQITIVGLGEIGTSLGLALKYQKNEILRVGCDIHKYAEQNAENIDAVDKIQHNIFNAVENADIIFLAIPTDELEEVIKLIGHELKEGAVIFETCDAKVSARNWVNQYLKDPTHYAGLYIALNAAWVTELSDEHHTAHEDLFKSGTIFISSSVNTAPSVVKLASDLATLVGAHSAFCEAEELDGLIAPIFDIPYLVGNAVFDTAKRQNSWREARKLGGKTFARITEPVTMKPDREKMGKSLLENRDNSLRMLNEFIVTLKDYRDAIQNGDAAGLDALLKKNQNDREEWLKEYKAAAWRHEEESQMRQPSAGEYIGQMFLGGLARKKK